MFGSFDFDPIYFTGFLLGFVIGTTFHEFMHAYSALLLGDNTAQREGRVTLNPAAHFDPIGFIMGVLLALGIGFLAWGRPVPVNPYALRFGRRGMAIVAVAGPLSNLAFAGLLTLVYRFGGTALPADVHTVLGYMILINMFLFAFNLIPIPPLDGYNILVGILPNYWTIILEPLRRYSLPILLTMVFFLPYIGQSLARTIPGFSLDPVREALIPVITLLQRLLLGFG
ncbi:MAG TPA: site-2 protease family protein [Chloroflexia bacterium]|nr:site-2 protease family protein [Chloroflexia bacterium]